MLPTYVTPSCKLFRCWMHPANSATCDFLKNNTPTSATTSSASIYRTAGFSILEVHWPLPDRKYKLPAKLPLNGTDSEGTWLHAVTVYYKIFYLKTMLLPICHPAACDQQDIDLVVQHVNQKIDFKLQVTSSITIADTTAWSLYPHVKIPALVIVLLFLLLTILSTAYSFLLQSSSSNAPLLIRAFDAGSNMQQVFRLPGSEMGQRLMFLNGIRFQYLLVCIIGHMYFPTSQEIIPFAFGAVQFSRKRVLYSVLANTVTPMLSVNFVMGASLAYITWHREVVVNKKKVSMLVYVALRFVRSLPVIGCLHPLHPGLPAQHGLRTSLLSHAEERDR